MLRVISSLNYSLLAALLLLSAVSCREDVDEFRPYVFGPSQESLMQLLGEVPAAATVTTFTLQGLNHDSTLTTPSGLRIVLTDPDALFTNANNQPVAASTCPHLQVEVVEALDRRGLIGNRLHTATYPEGQLLETGGGLHIRITCDGTPLRLLPNRTLKVQIPVSAPESNMLTYSGITSNSEDFLGWQASGEPAYLAEWISGSEVRKGYEVYPQGLGWIGVGRVLPETVSNFCVELPTAMTSQTARVMVVFQGVLAVANLQYDAGDQRFCFQAPKGYPVQAIVVSKLGAQYWLGQRETEIGTHTILPLEPQKTSEATLLEFLQNL